jgi:Family of unknown function (DUF6282)
MTPSVSTRSLAGVIDIHCHCGPDSLARTIDAIDLARLAKERGMRGIVIKNHYEPTASVAYLARKAVPGIEVFGGVTLNLASGGMNPYAVEYLAEVSGGAGRFVWMGSLDTEAQVRYSKDDRPFVAVARDGELLPEAIAVISAIAHHNLVLETGHSTPEEVLLLAREARRRGVRHIVVTHAMIAPIHFQIAHMREAVELGAFIEFVYNGLIGPFKEFEFADYARAIQAVGAQHCVLSSDLGQPVNPVHPDGLAAFFDGLEREGLTPDEIDQMSKVNPARILGLE